MFILKNSFTNFDDNKQPYSIEVEKDNLYYHLNGRCDEKGYAITFSGARAFINVPEVKTFKLDLNLLHNKSHAKGYNETFAVMFGYDRRARVGYQVEFVHVESGSTKIRLIKTLGKTTEVIKEQAYDFLQECDKKYHVHVEVLDSKVICSLDSCVFECELESVNGKVAILRESAFLEIYVSDLVFETEEITEEKIGEYNFVIPNYNGMFVPYTLTLNLYALGESITKIDYEFNEGLFTHDTRDTFVGDSWAMLYEEFDSIYFKINGSKRYYINNNVIRVFEENFTPKDKGMYAIKESVCDLHRAIGETWREPKKGSITVKEFGEVETVTFGYKNARCFRSEFAASPMQYVYDKNGNVLYIGEPIDEDYSLMVSSPLYSSLESLIPTTVYDRESLIEHLKDNHYFLTTDKKIEFYIDLRSKFNYDDLTLNVYLQDAFYNNIEEVSSFILDKPYKYAYESGKNFGVELKSLPLGVYHLYVEVLRCGKKVYKHRSAFEVIDPNSNVSPQKASGLISCHVGDSGKMFCPNLWAKMPDFNVEHYIDILLVTPIDANIVRPWEVYPIFKREITTWMNQRCITTSDILAGKHYEYPITENADYIYFPTPGDDDTKTYHRYDFYVYRHVKSHMINMLESFLTENEDIRKELSMKNVKEEFTLEQYKALMQKYHTKFLNYCLPIIRKMFIEQFNKVKEINPKAKRFSYGPLSIYNCSYGGGYSTKWQGYDPKHLSEMFDGYMQLEDYPHDCSYSTTKGAFYLGSLRMLDPKLRVFPELYDTWLEGCPDEALPGAHPPLGYYYCEPYACMTQIFEYVYNTANYLVKDNSYDYWRDYGLMVYSAYVIDVKAKFDEYMPAWGIARQNLPKKPTSGSVFIYEIPEEDDRFNPDCSYDYFAGGDYGYCGRPVHNISETGLSYVYKTMREAGVPVKTLATFDVLDSLTSSDLDYLVIPSLKGVDASIVDNIRKLYDSGTPIIAVSEVTGLEDIFGVKLNRHNPRLTYLDKNGEIEYIAPINTEVYYDVVDAEVLLSADNNEPIITKKGNAILINAPIGEVGIETLKYAAFIGAYNISLHIENILTEEIRKLTTNGFTASNRCGLTTFVNEKGEEMLLLVDYSKDLEGVDYKVGRTVEVTLPQGYTDAENVYRATTLAKKHENGVLTKITVQMCRQESVLIKLVK